MRLSADMADLDWQVVLASCKCSRGKLRRGQPLWVMKVHRFSRRVDARPLGSSRRLQARSCSPPFRWDEALIGISTKPQSGRLNLKCIAADQVPRAVL